MARYNKAMVDKILKLDAGPPEASFDDPEVAMAWLNGEPLPRGVVIVLPNNGTPIPRTATFY